MEISVSYSPEEASFWKKFFKYISKVLLVYILICIVPVLPSAVYRGISNNHLIDAEIGKDWNTKGFLSARIGDAQKGDVVNIIIDSPGGSVTYSVLMAEAIVDARERGVTVKCWADGWVASGAMLVYAVCEEKYSTQNSQFLWHYTRERLDDVYTPFELLEKAKDGFETSRKLLEVTRLGTGITDSDTFYRYAEDEKTLSVDELNGLCDNCVKVVGKVPAYGFLRYFWIL